MKIEKRYEMQSKQLLDEIEKNNKLQDQITDLKMQLEIEKTKNKRLDETISELEQIRDKWKKDHEEMDKMKAEYKILIYQLRLLRKRFKKL